MGIFSKETLQCGAVLHGRYQIMETIGAVVGFEIKYKAKDANSGKYVFIREYFPVGIVFRAKNGCVQLCSSLRKQDFICGKNALSQEAQRLIDLNDVPGTLDVIDLFEENNTVYIVTEILEGMRLSSYIREYDFERETFAIHIAGAVSDTLRKMHEHGILHLNVAPQTVFICKDLNVKLLELSFFPIKEDGQGKKSRNCILYPGFAAPEQYESIADVGAWTDIYSLGAVLYYIVTGDVPEESTNRLCYKDPIKEPKDINPDIPKELSNIIMRAIELDPKDRFQNADEFMRALSGEKIKGWKKTKLFHKRG